MNGKEFRDGFIEALSEEYEGYYRVETSATEGLGRAVKARFRRLMGKNGSNCTGSPLADDSFKRCFLHPELLCDRAAELPHPYAMLSTAYLTRCAMQPKGGSKRGVRLALQGWPESGAVGVKGLLEEGPDASCRAAALLFARCSPSKMLEAGAEGSPQLLELVRALYYCVRLEGDLDGEDDASLNLALRQVKQRVCDCARAESIDVKDASESQAARLLGIEPGKAERRALHSALDGLFDPLMHLVLLEGTKDFLHNAKYGKSLSGLEIIGRYCEVTGMRLRGGFTLSQEDEIEEFFEGANADGLRRLFVPLAVDDRTGASLCIIGSGLLYGFERKRPRCFYAVLKPGSIAENPAVSQIAQRAFDLGKWPYCSEVLYGIECPMRNDESALFNSLEDAKAEFEKQIWRPGARGSAMDRLWEINPAVPEGCPDFLEPFFRPREQAPQSYGETYAHGGDVVVKHRDSRSRSFSS